MTKYILHGGNTSDPLPSNDRFFREIVKGISEPVSLLLVYFASEKQKWARLFKQDRDNFRRNNPRKEIVFVLADKKKFVEQARQANAIYLRGGKSSPLEGALKNIGNLNGSFCRQGSRWVFCRCLRTVQILLQR